MAARIYCLIDGAYVRERLTELDIDWTHVNLYRLASIALDRTSSLRGSRCAGDVLLLARVLVYDAVPEVPGGDVEDWLRRNHALDDVSAQFGKLVEGPRRVRRQKTVDVQLAVDAVRFANRNVCECLLLIAGDADFIPVLEAVKDVGPLAAVCVFRSNYSQELLDSADRFSYFDDERRYYEKNLAFD